MADTNATNKSYEVEVTYVMRIRAPNPDRAQAIAEGIIAEGHSRPAKTYAYASDDDVSLETVEGGGDG